MRIIWRGLVVLALLVLNWQTPISRERPADLHPARLREVSAEVR